MDAGLTNLLIALGTAIGIPVAGALGTLGVKAIQLQTLKLGDKNFANKREAATIGVFTAEQLAKSGAIPKEERKSKALEVAQSMLKEKKVKYDPDTLGAIIEAVVWQDTPSVSNTSSVTTTTGGKALSETSSTTIVSGHVLPGVVLPPPGG